MSLFRLAALFLLSAAITVVHGADKKFEKYYKPSYDTPLQKKCEMLKSNYKAAFVGDRCFASTNSRHKVPLKEWQSLHKQCNHIEGYDAHMAHIWTERQLDILLEQYVVENDDRYFIGARQSPTDEEAGFGANNHDRHNERWGYFTANGTKVGDLNADLWLKDEPDNQGVSPPEYVVTMELLESALKIGFNDANPDCNTFSILCEYVDFMSCPDGWTMIGANCYKVFDSAASLEDADNECSQQSGVDSPALASIHDDALNMRLAELARTTLKSTADSGDASHSPVMFGLFFNGKVWKNKNTDVVDFFRWYHRAAFGEPTKFEGKTNMVALLNTRQTGANGEPRYTYWTIGNGKDSYPYICQGGAKTD